MLDVDAILWPARPAVPDTPERRAHLAFMAELRRVSELPWEARNRVFADPDSAYRRAYAAWARVAGFAALLAAPPAGNA